jgi:hypothetical protein
MPIPNSEQEANLWWTHLSHANAQGTFLYGLTAVIVSGTKAKTLAETASQDQKN